MFYPIPALQMTQRHTAATALRRVGQFISANMRLPHLCSASSLYMTHSWSTLLP